VHGRVDKPFVLMSWPSEKPNLNAVDVLDAYNITLLHCLHFNGESNEGYGDLLREKMMSTPQPDEEHSLSDFERESNGLSQRFFS
jgi:hypothetical protein